MEKGNAIQVEELVTYDIYLKYYLFCLFRGRLYKQGPILVYIVSTFGIVLALFTGFSFGFDIVVLVVTIILVVMLLLMTFLLTYVPKKYYKTAKKFLETPSRYKFTEEFLYVESHSEEASGSTKIKYEALHKIYELEDMIYIFINNSQAYILEKKIFNEESFQWLRNILIDKLGKKYKIYKK